MDNIRNQVHNTVILSPDIKNSEVDSWVYLQGHERFSLCLMVARGPSSRGVWGAGLRARIPTLWRTSLWNPGGVEPPLFLQRHKAEKLIIHGPAHVVGTTGE